jgi:hypothetical protein
MSITRSIVRNVVRGGESDPVIVPPTPFLLESFDSDSGWTTMYSPTLSVDTTDKVDGTGSLSIESTGGAFGPVVYKAAIGEYDTSLFNVVALYIHFDEDPEYQNCSSVNFRFRDGSPFYGDTVIAGAINTKTGGHWVSLDMNEFSGWDTVGTSNLQARITLSESNAIVNEVRADALLANAAGIPTLVLTFDDIAPSQHSYVRGALNDRGLLGTFYVPTANIGLEYGDRGTYRLSWDQLTDLKNDGHLIALDGTSDDTSMTAHTDTDAAIADLASMQLEMKNHGLDGGGMWHIAYPNGAVRVNGTRLTVDDVVSDGSDVLVMSDTAGITSGMKVSGFNVPRITRVVSVDSGTEVTVDNNIAAQTRPIMFTDDSGEFHGNKLQDALSDAGYKTARTTMPDTVYTRFGIGSGQALEFNGVSTSNVTASTMIGWVDQAISKGQTLVTYSHSIVPVIDSGLDMLESEFDTWMDYVKTKVDAGELQVLTIDGLYNRDGSEREISI